LSLTRFKLGSFLSKTQWSERSMMQELKKAFYLCSL